MQTDLNEKLEEIEKLIRLGQGDVARKELLKLLKTPQPRRYLTQIAALSRRLSLPMLGLRLLNPLVHPQKRKLTNPTPLEMIEYASCLSILGAHQEAIKLLEQVSGTEHPQSLLAMAFALVAEWDYEASIPVLKTYLSSNGLDAYKKLIGEANLAAAFVFERLASEANPVLQELRGKTQKDYPFLYAKILELDAQLAFLQKDWELCEIKLNEASKSLTGDMGLDSFFIKKWRVLLKVMKYPKSNESLLELNSLRVEATKWKHWGTLRQCDYYEAIATRNQELFLKVFFGTPYESIKKYLVKDWGTLIEIPKTFLWRLGAREGVAPKLSLYPEFKKGQAMHSLILAITSDFYAPQAITSIHSSLFPEDFFNPESSPVKIHQLVKRTRKVLASHASPIQLLEDSGNYYLNSNLNCELEVSLNREAIKDRPTHQKLLLSERFYENFFTATEAASILGVSSSSALKLIQALLKEGVLERQGSRRSAVYRFVQSFKKAG